MPLRCYVFSSDEETSAMLRQILASLGAEGESCSNAVLAAEKITNQLYQIVIIDWDNQPEAGLLLSTARERKAAERPITLAVVSSDLSVPAALQAGANSVLRKPIVIIQAKDTLTTARDLLRSMQRPEPQASAAAAGASAPLSNPADAKKRTLRAGEFLQTPTLAPGGHFETETEVPAAPEVTTPQVDPLKDLEPTAASVTQSQPAPAPPAAPDGRGLEWYLKNRVAGRENGAGQVSASRGNPDLIGYGEAPYSPPKPEPEPVRQLAPSRPEFAEIHTKPDLPKLPDLDPHVQSPAQERREAQLFSYLENGVLSDESDSSASSLWKRAILPALLLAALAVTFAPQAPWHAKIRPIWIQGQQELHNWLNPQPVTPPQAPAAHETFSRAGDEYKLPVAEAIPDATTDPAQVKVLPVIDPTAKKPSDTSTGDSSASPPDTLPAGTDSTSPAATPPSDNLSPTASNTQPSAVSVPPISGLTPASKPAAPPLTASHSDGPPLVVSTSVSSSSPKAPHYVSSPGVVPPSLRSQLAPTTPAGGNKPVEAALPSIEPVDVPEAVERALLTDQPAPAYPASAKGLQGIIVLQVMVGRDGTVQDAKFMQGSLVFARPAIDTVKQWKFKPYIMNGRPVSIETQLSLKFKPGQ